MAYDPATANAIANEARKQELRSKIAGLRGKAESEAALSGFLSRINNDTYRSLTSAQEELAHLELGAGPGVTDDFGERSAIDQILRGQRFAGKEAAIDFVKTIPDCSEENALSAWKSGVIAWQDAGSCPESDKQTPEEIEQLAWIYSRWYRRRLVAAGAIAENTWEAHRQWIIDTPKNVIMGL